MCHCLAGGIFSSAGTFGPYGADLLALHDSLGWRPEQTEHVAKFAQVTETAATAVEEVIYITPLCVRSHGCLAFRRGRFQAVHMLGRWPRKVHGAEISNIQGRNWDFSGMAREDSIIYE